MSATKTKRPKWQTLTWWSARQQWRIQYQGKRYTLGPTGVDRCRRTHDVALKEWISRKAIIDHRNGDTEGRRIAERMRLVAAMVDPYPRDGDDMGRLAVAMRPYAEMVAEQVADHRGDIPSNIKALADEVDTAIVRAVEESQDDRSRWGISDPKDKSKPSLRQAIDDFMEYRKTHIEDGKIGESRWINLKRQLLEIADWFGEECSVDVINDDNLERFYVHLVKNETKPKAHRLLMAYRQFAKRLQIKKLIQPMVRLDDPDLRVRVPKKKIQPMPIEDWRARYNAGGDDVRLYLLLMANCGMYQGDISDLKPSEVDWKNGYIERVRSKRDKDEEDAVKVKWKLWDETFDLLKKLGKQEGDTVLTNRKGDRLVRYTLNGDKIKSTDNIRTAIQRAEKRQDLPYCQPKRIRKTSASLLFAATEHARFAQYFLAHQPIDVAGGFYIKPTEEQMNAATEYLRKQYLG